MRAPSPPITTVSLDNASSVSAPTTPSSITFPGCDSFCSTVPDSVRLLCKQCRSNLCTNPHCRQYLPDLCLNCRSKRKRSVQSSADVIEIIYQDETDIKNLESYFPNNRLKRSESSPSLYDPFEVMFSNDSEPFSCRELLKDTPTITNIDRTCESLAYQRLSDSVDFAEVVCTPEGDVFNPCKDLLGESNVLYIAIWLVIILAFVGNGMVFLVFIGYSSMIRHRSQDLFCIHFMYFNLAMADMLMTFYLFIIAVVNAVTQDDFFLTDIAWRTSPGCKFAGFCAITSTSVSVYVLVVITIERTHTIVSVFKRRKLTNCQVYIIMAVGWIFGVLVASLPMVGVSDYNTVAICLPFNVAGVGDKAFVVSLLLATGVAFISILICYVVIFQQILCNKNKMSPSQVSNRRTADVKIAIRIFVLIFTNFVCWFPIALLGLTAAFGKNLINDLEFARWAVVFIFPINACLNPFLYSLTTRAFREHTVLLLNKCGLCKRQAQCIRHAQVGTTASCGSKSSNTSSNFNRASLTLRKSSLATQTSCISMDSQLNHRNSSMSLMSMESQPTANLYSPSLGASSPRHPLKDDVWSLPRGSDGSSGAVSALVATTFNSIFYLSSHTPEDNVDSPKHHLSPTDISLRVRRIGSNGLVAVPEEVEVSEEAVEGRGVVTVNPVYQEDVEKDLLSKKTKRELIGKTSSPPPH